MYNCDDQSCLHIFLRSSNIWSFIYSLVFFTIYGYITNSQSDQLPVSLIAQLVEHCTGIAEVPVQAWMFFSGFNFITVFKRCVYNWDDQSCLQKVTYISVENVRGTKWRKALLQITKMHTNWKKKSFLLSFFLSPTGFNSSVSAQLICVVSNFQFPVL